MSKGLGSIFAKLQEGLKSRGVSGVLGLRRLFKETDADGNGSLNFAEFGALVLQEWAVLGLSRGDLRHAFDFLDADGNGSISTSEFERMMQKPLNPRRLRIVRKVFRALDLDRSGSLEADDLEAVLDVSKHPEVVAGLATKEEVLGRFLSHFSVEEGDPVAVDAAKVAAKAGTKISLGEWEQFYTAAGLFVETDDEFERLVERYSGSGSGSMVVWKYGSMVA
jgi:hypothetical protein